MAAPRLPNATNVLNGGWQKNPNRARPPTVEDDEPASETAPALELISFDQAWAAIIEMAAPGVLRRRDEGCIFECARLHMKIRNQTVLDIRAGRQSRVENSDSTQYRNWLAKIGCTPVDSHHVAAPGGGKGKGEFD
jgi:hypothetical protein